jgi:hypothetical protein
MDDTLRLLPISPLDFGHPRLKESSRLSQLGQGPQGARLFAILIVIHVGSLNDWQKEMRLKVVDEMREGHTDH